MKMLICLAIGGAIVHAKELFVKRFFKEYGKHIRREERAKSELVSTQTNIGNRICRKVMDAALQNCLVVVTKVDHASRCGYWITVRRPDQTYPDYVCQVYINLFDNTQVGVTLEKQLTNHYGTSDKDVKEVIQIVQEFVANYSSECSSA